MYTLHTLHTLHSWKSPYFMKFKNEEEWKRVKEYFDPS